MAKKWQDVEFVDYKERQRRRRLKKRLSVQDEIRSGVVSRWTVAIISFASVAFFAILGTSLWYVLADSSKKKDAESKMFISVKAIEGDCFQRKDPSEEWQPIGPLTTKYFNTWQFRVADGAKAELETFDQVMVKLISGAELYLHSMEIFNDNQGSKSNLTLEEGEVLVDSRSSSGLLEIKAGTAVLYVRPSLFKIIKKEDQVTVKVHTGAVKFENGTENKVISSNQYASLEKGALKEPQKFNLLAEKW